MEMPNGDARFWLGDWLVIPAEGRLQRGGQQRHLEPRTMALLCGLADGGCAVRSADALLDACWNGQCLGDNAVHKHIAILRAALGDSARKSRYIATVHRRGYRLLLPVVPFEGWIDGRDPELQVDALLQRLCGLEDVLEAGARCVAERGPGCMPGAPSPILRDNNRLRTLCAILLGRCRVPDADARCAGPPADCAGTSGEPETTPVEPVTAGRDRP